MSELTAAGDGLPADYVSARFRAAVTFRGITLDSVVASEQYVLSHTAAFLLLTWRPVAERGIDPQVRAVPWGNVACVEPGPAFLKLLAGATGRTAKGK